MAATPTLSPPATHPGLPAVTHHPGIPPANPPGREPGRELGRESGVATGRGSGKDPARFPEPEGEFAAPGVDAAERALIPSGARERPPGELVLSAPLARMPVELDVAIPIPDFRVRNLLALAPGQLIEARWPNGEDVPLSSGDVQIAWTEFEVIESQLAVRITRLG